MRAGSFRSSWQFTLSYLLLATSALASNSTSRAPGPFEALNVGDARCYAEPSKLPQAIREQAETPSLDASEALQQPTPVAVEPKEPVIELDLALPSAIPLEAHIPVVTTRVESLQEQPDLSEFPSFAEWKERHLAHAAAAAIKEAQHHPQRKRTNHSHDVRQQPGKHPAEDEREASLARSASGVHPDKLVSDTSGTDGIALSIPSVPSPGYQKLVQPVPHAGTGDQILDPLESLKDRTNYASFDCSATLIRASKRTKSASSILSSKKDRYMLSPCSASEKYVIIELCDEIQIDTIVLANLEFFSSMFKLFRVKAGTAYPESTGTWSELGTFRASNVRGLQVFRPPEPTGGGFYRYLRIDFLSHYGTEYYCPVSILRVYGHNQLEAYRRDQERDALLLVSEDKEAGDEEEESLPLLDPEITVPVVAVADAVQSEGALESSENEASPLTEPQPTAQIETPNVAIASSASGTTHSDTSASTHVASSSKMLDQSSTLRTSVKSTGYTSKPGLTTAPSESEYPTLSSFSATQGQATSLSDAASATSLCEPSAQGISKRLSSTADVSSAVVAASVTSSSQHGNNDSTPDPSSSAISAERSTSLMDASSLANQTLPGSTHITAVVSTTGLAETAGQSSSGAKTDASSRSALLPVQNVSTSITTTATSTRLPILQTVIPPSARRNETRQPAPQVIYTHASNPQPNESIYGTIMKRLLALEFNSTLTTTYIEEHTRTVWSALRRIEDKILNLEKSRSQQDQLLRRLMLDLELHRARIESERTELSAQISMLSREMTLEKRLGIAQLLALIILLFFVILTRGSPSTPFVNIASPPMTASTAVFRSARPRPRSVYERPEGLPRLSGDFSLPRDRRQYNAERRAAMNGSALSMSRTGSIKKSSRNGLPKRATSPTHAVPFRLNGDHLPTLDPLSPGLSTTGLSTAGLSSVSEASGSVPSTAALPLMAAVLAREEAEEPLSRPSTAATVRDPLAGSVRSSPVDVIKRKLRLIQPLRAATPESTPSTATESRQAPASAPERRKLFSLPPKMRRRSTVASADADEEEGNPKAWLSTSEDSADDSSTRQYSFSMPRSASQATVPFPPSPDPSEAEQPLVS